jgi:predicted transcriptional regulator
MALNRPLSGLEQQVMDVVWSRGNVTAADVQTMLMPQRVLKDSTIRTILTRLEEKRYVRHQVNGRTFVYSSVEPPSSVAVRAVKQIIDRFCHGSMESLLAGMVEDDVVDPKELRQMVNRLTKQRSVKPGKLP